jgi:hypothetical protein
VTHAKRLSQPECGLEGGGICPLQQLTLCAQAHRAPTEETLCAVAARLPEAQGLRVIDISERATVVAGVDEQRRYYLQHMLGFQIHDQRHPHPATTARACRHRLGHPHNEGFRVTDMSWDQQRYLVVDVEGNGARPPDLVELAAVPIIGGVTGEPTSWLVRPSRLITPQARRVRCGCLW